MEIERLKKVQNVSDSVARLPEACLEDLTSAPKIKEAKASALHDALMDLKSNDKGRNDLIDLFSWPSPYLRKQRPAC